MPGLPQPLYSQIREALLACDEISNPDQLRVILRTSALRSFVNSLKTANNPNTQVDYLIGDLTDRRSATGENGLVLLLELLVSHHGPIDARYGRLMSLEIALQGFVSGKLSPASTPNKLIDHREALRQLRDVLSNLYPDATSALLPLFHLVGARKTFDIAFSPKCRNMVMLLSG